MSWFKDIAGRAENLLNNIDKSAGQVLLATGPSDTNTSRSGGGGGGSDSGGHQWSDDNMTDSFSTITAHSIRTISSSASLATNTTTTTGVGGGNGQSSRGHTRASSFESIGSRESSRSSKASTTSVAASASADRQIDDETLFDFLNNKGDDIPEEGALIAVSTTPSSASTTSSSSVAVVTETLTTSGQSSPAANVTVPFSGGGVEDYEGRIRSLALEISSLNRRNIELETEVKRLAKRIGNLQQKLNISDGTVRELQSREADLHASLGAKDSQIGVLKVRLQETDAELQQRLNQIETLEDLNESLRTAQEANLSTVNDSVDGYRHQIRQLEAQLQQERDELRAVQTQTMAQIGRLEDNQKSLVDEISLLQRNLSLEKASNGELEARLKNSAKCMDELDKDYSEFKVKASKTLADKDELIRALKAASTTSSDGADGSSSISSADGVDHTTGAAAGDDVRRLLQSQCDAMVLELQEFREKYDTLKKAYDRLYGEDMVALTTRIGLLTEQLDNESRVRLEVEQELKESRDESRHFQDDLHQIRSSLESRIMDRDVEIDKLRKQLVSKRSAGALSGAAGGGGSDNEQRFRNLTDNLIQKQTIIESLTSEKHSLALQLERSEQRLRDAINASHKSAEVSIGIHHSPSFGNLVNRSSAAIGGSGGVRPLVEDYPDDGNVTRRVKRAYGQIDAFSIRLGNFLRVYPSARAAMLVYVLILHIWVAIVLIYYEPEQHGPGYNYKMPTPLEDRGGGGGTGG